MSINKLPKLTIPKPLVAIKGYAISPIEFENTGGAVVSFKVSPELPIGFELMIGKNTCVLSGKPRVVSANTTYKLMVFNEKGLSGEVSFEVAVHEAPVREQREEIIKVNDERQDLDTPRSQVENAMNDAATMGSQIKPHEKFLRQPMGDDSHLTAQAANNVDAQERAQSSPELTPAPSAQQQYQNILSAKPDATPTPSR